MSENEVPIETELKFELDDGLASRLAALPLLQGRARGRAAKLVSTYFDTPELLLQEHRLVLRIRKSGRRLIQTIKSEQDGDGPFARAEWETRVTRVTPDPAAIVGTVLDGLVEPEALVPVFESRVTRAVYDIQEGDGHVELCIDRGEVVAGERSSTFHEVELELKSGAPEALFDLARRLNADVPLRLSTMTKAGRGYDLVSGSDRTVSKARGVPLDPDETTRNAFRALGRECLRHLLANTPLLVGHRDSEAVHQMRVAIRRLRAAMSLFRSVLGDPQSEAVKNGLRWLGRELGQARNLDVFIEEVIEPMRGERPDEPGMDDLLDYFAKERDEAYQRVLAMVHDKRFTGVLIETAAWIETGDWARGLSEEQAALLERPVRKLAASELSRRHRKVMRRGRELAALPAEARHRLRIDIKKVRYAAEFFAGLFTGRKADKRRRKLQKLLTSLQDNLGALNDAVVNHESEVRLATEASGRSAVARRRAYAAGMVAGHQFARVDPLLRSATKGYARFKKAEPFWEKE